MHRLWLIRHGETASNAAGEFQGHMDVPLNETGRAQAAALAPLLANVDFNLVLASDLQRAATTAELVVAGRVPVERTPALREMHFGVLQGVPYGDAALILAQHGLADAWRDGSMARRGTRVPQGESPRQVRTRLQQVVRRVDAQMAAHPAGADVLVVAHGGTLAVLMTTLLNIPLHRRVAFRFHNCSVTRLVQQHGGWQLDAHNLDLAAAAAAGATGAAVVLRGVHPAGEADQTRS